MIWAVAQWDQKMENERIFRLKNSNEFLIEIHIPTHHNKVAEHQRQRLDLKSREKSQITSKLQHLD